MVSRRHALLACLAAVVPCAHASRGVFVAPPVLPEEKDPILAAAERSRAANTLKLAEPSSEQAALARKLGLSSGSVLVVDRDTREVLLTKGARAVRPIASITKLMTALLVVESGQPLDEMLTITEDDVDTIKNTNSRLWVGARLTRGELLHLALMSSENRAAHALGRNTPGGVDAFVLRMNQRAAQLGMTSTRFADPTGLSDENRSTAIDLARLVMEASKHPLIRELSTDVEAQVPVGDRTITYRTSNRLVRNPSWDIELQKTGYIREAGRCLVMQATLAGRKVIMVLLDAATPALRMMDAQRLRRWLEGASLEELVQRPARAVVRRAAALRSRRSRQVAARRASRSRRR